MPTKTVTKIPGDPDDLICDTCPQRFGYRGDLWRTFEAARVAGWHIYQRVQVQYRQSTGEAVNLVDTRILCPSCIGTNRIRIPAPPVLEGQADILEELQVSVEPVAKSKKGKKGREMS